MSIETSSTSQLTLPDPKFIKYLLNPDLEYECYFLVGNETLDIAVERIGVVKKMLYAHSDVLRVELQDSKIAEKDDVEVNDLYPDTFRNLLRFVYGFDNTATLSFNDADNLLYASEKYMITDLKNKVSTRLMSLLTYDNICSLLNNPACYKTLELNSEITRILQQETSKVLESPPFLDLSSTAFLHILQQERLQAPEMELWRAAFNWAKNKADTEDGPTLRATLTNQMKVIRVCTLELNDFFTEVVASNILTDAEVKLVCLSHGTKEKQPQLTDICNEIKSRPRTFIYSQNLQADFTYNTGATNLSQILFSVTPKDKCMVELKSLTLQTSNNCTRQQVRGTVEIKGPGLKKDCPTEDGKVTVDFNKKLCHDTQMDINLTIEGELVILLPGKKYDIKITSSSPLLYACNCQHTFTFGDFSVDVGIVSGYYYSNLKSIKYNKKDYL